MSATSDLQLKRTTVRDFDQSEILREKLQRASEVNRGGRIFLGSALTISAAGLWLVPVDSGDAAMQLIKLLVSVVLAALGMMFIFSLRQTEAVPEVQVDLAKRELRIVKQFGSKPAYVDAVHEFDDLSDIKAEDLFLSARDKQGQVVLSVALPDEVTQDALREALRDIA